MSDNTWWMCRDALEQRPPGAYVSPVRRHLVGPVVEVEIRPVEPARGEMRRGWLRAEDGPPWIAGTIYTERERDVGSWTYPGREIEYRLLPPAPPAEEPVECACGRHAVVDVREAPQIRVTCSSNTEKSIGGGKFLQCCWVGPYAVNHYTAVKEWSRVMRSARGGKA